MDDFINKGVIKYFKDPGITVEEHLNRIMKKDINLPMFNNAFHLSACIPKTENAKENAGKLIEGAKLQSSWISNFKKSLERTTLSKNIANWGKTIQLHSTGQTENDPKYCPKIDTTGTPKIVPQTDTKPSAFKQTMNKRGKDGNAVCHGRPSCITSEAWNAYINAPFDQIARKAWVKTITFPCIDKTKTSDMAPPYGITYESVTTDLGNLATKNGLRKVDVQLYNG